MTFYAILHIPSNELFPNIARGSSWFHFGDKTTGCPKLFKRRQTAAMFLTNYLKGPFGRDDDGELCHLSGYKPRPRHDFQVVEINLEITNV